MNAPSRACGLLLALTAAAPAAPVPAKRALPPFEKYLPDDADFVAVVNVRQALASPLFTKNLRKHAEGLLAGAEVQALLKGTGFDPLKDVDWVIRCEGRGSYAPRREDPYLAGPVYVLHGRFDAAKLRAKLVGMAKDAPEDIRALDIPGGRLYEFKKMLGRPRVFVGLPDGTTLVLAQDQALAADVLTKATGKKKVALKHKELPPLLKEFRPDVAVQAVGLGSMVTNSFVLVGTRGAETEVRCTTLADQGFRRLRVRVTVGAEAKGGVALTVKSKDELAEKTKEVSAILETEREEAKKREGGTPLAKFLEGVKVKAGADALTLEGQADAEGVRAVLEELFAAPTWTEIRRDRADAEGAR